MPSTPSQNHHKRRRTKEIDDEDDVVDYLTGDTDDNNSPAKKQAANKRLNTDRQIGDIGDTPVPDGLVGVTRELNMSTSTLTAQYWAGKDESYSQALKLHILQFCCARQPSMRDQHPLFQVEYALSLIHI